MRRVLCVVTLAALVFLACGCGGMMAKEPMKVSIAVNAVQAGLDQEKAKSGTMTDPEAVVVLTKNAATFATYAGGKTVNLFEYLFSKDKSILVNGKYAFLLDNTSILAAETVLRASSGLMPPGWTQLMVGKEAVVLIDVKAALDGKRSPSE